MSYERYHYDIFLLLLIIIIIINTKPVPANTERITTAPPAWWSRRSSPRQWRTTKTPWRTPTVASTLPVGFGTSLALVLLGQHTIERLQWIINDARRCPHVDWPHRILPRTCPIIVGIVVLLWWHTVLSGMWYIIHVITRRRIVHVIVLTRRRDTIVRRRIMAHRRLVIMHVHARRLVVPLQW